MMQNNDDNLEIKTVPIAIVTLEFNKTIFPLSVLDSSTQTKQNDALSINRELRGIVDEDLWKITRQLVFCFFF